MSDRLHELLDAYAEAFTAVGGVAGLNPPVTQAEIDEAEGILGYEIPEEALSLWRWRNGQELNASNLFLHANAFPRLTEAARHYRSYTDPETSHRRRELDPIQPVPGIVIADGWQFSIAAVSFREQDFGSIWGWAYYGMGADDVHRVFDSIEDFVDCHLRILQTGAIDVDTIESGRVTLEVRGRDERITALDVPDNWRWMAGF